MTGSDMDCAEIQNSLLGGTVPVGPAVEAHVRDCAPCAELLRDQAALGRQLSRRSTDPRDRGPTDQQTALWASVESAISAESGPRAWLRSRSTPVRLLVAAAVGAGIVTVGGQSGVAPGARAVGWLVLFLLAGLASSWVLVAPLGRPRPAVRTREAIVWFALALPLVHALASSSATGTSAGELGFVEQAFACFVYGSVLALPFFVVVWTLDRSDRPRLMLLSGMAGVAGLVANAALATHCTNTAPLHLAAGHATIGTAIAVIAMLVASLAIARRRSPS